MTVPNLNYKRCYVDWGGRCAYCNIGLPRIKWDGKVRAGIDHFIPLSKGGQNSRGNRVLSCYPCNLAKDDTDPDKLITIECGLEIAATLVMSYSWRTWRSCEAATFFGNRHGHASQSGARWGPR